MSLVTVAGPAQKSTVLLYYVGDLVFPPVFIDLLAHNPGCRSPRQNRQDKTTLPFWRNLSSISPSSLPYPPPSQHHYQVFTFPPGRVNLATPSTASHLVSLSQRGVSVDMASEKTPEVGDKGTWSFLQRVAREQPFSFCGLYTSYQACCIFKYHICFSAYQTRLTYLPYGQPLGLGMGPLHPEKSRKRKPKAKSRSNPNAATPSRNPPNPTTLPFTSPGPAMMW